jgi:MoaA/NifB/PqqE/SkfB family radical SAM enzyme
MILLKVNTACNLECSYCWYVIDPRLAVPVREEMDAGSMVDMLARLSIRRGDVVYLSGGEAVLRRDIEGVCRHLRDASATVYLTTNGMLLSRLLALAPLIDGFVVSIDSVESDYHDSVRGGHATTFANLPALRAAKPVCVSVVLSRQNIGGLPALAARCISLGVESMFFQLLWYPPDHPERARACLSREDASTFTASMAALRAFSGQIRLPVDSYICALEASVRNGGAAGIVQGCFALEGYRATDPHGNINGCLPHAMLKGIRSSRDASSRVLGAAGGPTACAHFSEECLCLMGHFFTDLFDAQHE